MGAPRADSGQPGTIEAGAIFSCDYNFDDVNPSRLHSKSTQCARVQVEYPSEAEHHVAPSKLNSKQLHREGKNHQMLGFVVQSTGVRDGDAMVRKIECF